jgi:ankyrin repeat protein
LAGPTGNLDDPVCRGATALIAASFFGRLDLVQALLDRGADVNAKHNAGWTALRLARDVEVKALLEHAGAKP